jgi:hypothetical protein
MKMARADTTGLSQIQVDNQPLAFAFFCAYQNDYTFFRDWMLVHLTAPEHAFPPKIRPLGVIVRDNGSHQAGCLLSPAQSRWEFEPLVQVSAEVYQIKSLERIRWYAGTASPSCKNNSDLFDDKQGEGQSLSLRGTIKAAKKAEYGG